MGSFETHAGRNGWGRRGGLQGFTLAPIPPAERAQAQAAVEASAQAAEGADAKMRALLKVCCAVPLREGVGSHCAACVGIKDAGAADSGRSAKMP